MDAATETLLDAAVGELFPTEVAHAVAPCDTESSPYEEEVLAVARAVPGRRREFFSGRACAHRALAALGLDAGPIPVGTRREPVWPTGAVGSIAHAGGWSGAVVAASGDVWGLGFDLEVLEPELDDDVDRLVRTPAEHDEALAHEHPLAAHSGKLLFSIKEAVYKCLFPRTRWALEFHDVQVTANLERRRFAATIDQRFNPGRVRVDVVEGGFRVVNGYVVTALCIPHHAREVRSDRARR